MVTRTVCDAMRLVAEMVTRTTWSGESPKWSPAQYATVQYATRSGESPKRSPAQFSAMQTRVVSPSKLFGSAHRVKTQDKLRTLGTNSAESTSN